MRFSKSQFYPLPLFLRISFIANSKQMFSRWLRKSCSVCICQDVLRVMDRNGKEQKYSIKNILGMRLLVLFLSALALFEYYSTIAASSNSPAMVLFSKRMILSSLLPKERKLMLPYQITVLSNTAYFW